MAAWASWRRPARRSTCATRASCRSTRARTASRPSTSCSASCRWPAGPPCAPPSRGCAGRKGAVAASRNPAHGQTAARMRDGIESLDRATSWMEATLKGNRAEDALAGATPYLRLFGLTQGAAGLAEIALAAEAAMAGGRREPRPCRAHRHLPLLREKTAHRRARPRTHRHRRRVLGSRSAARAGELNGARRPGNLGRRLSPTASASSRALRGASGAGWRGRWARPARP